MAAKQKETEDALTPGHVPGASAGSSTFEVPGPGGANSGFTPMQVEELERQAINAKRTADQAEEKLHSAKTARVSPY